MRARVFEELANVATHAVSIAANVREEIRDLVRQRVEEAFKSFDMVTRQEFEVVREMLAQSRLEQERLKKDIEVLKKSHKKPARRKASK